MENVAEAWVQAATWASCTSPTSSSGANSAAATKPSSTIDSVFPGRLLPRWDMQHHQQSLQLSSRFHWAALRNLSRRATAKATTSTTNRP